MIVLSNNPMVWANSEYNCIKVDGLAPNVFYKAVDLLCSGKYSLFAHPVAGNERLLRNPYRTIVLSEKEVTEKENLYQISCLNRALNKVELIDYTEIPENTYKDYGIIDSDLCRVIAKGM